MSDFLFSIYILSIPIIIIIIYCLISEFIKVVKFKKKIIKTLESIPYEGYTINKVITKIDKDGYIDYMYKVFGNLYIWEYEAKKIINDHKEELEKSKVKSYIEETFKENNLYELIEDLKSKGKKSKKGK